MKKVVAMLLVLVMCLSMFVGCGDKPSTDVPGTNASSVKDKGAKITVLINRTDLKDTVLVDAKKAFEEKYADNEWTVTFETITDYEGDVLTRMSGGEYGDVLLIPNGCEQKYYSEYFIPVGKFDEVSAEWRGVANGKHYEGEVYGYPTMAGTNGVLYNVTLFKEAGIDVMPKTPEEFIDAMKALKEANADNKDFVPYYTNFKDSWTLNQWPEALNCAAGDPGYKDNALPWDDATFTTGVNSEVYGLLYDMVAMGLTEKDPTTTEWERSKIMLAEGDIGAMFLGGWAIAQFQDVAKDLGVDESVIGYMPYPFTAPDGKQYAPISTDYWLAVAKNTKYPDAAKAFQEWFMGDFDYFTKAGGLIPPQMAKSYPAIVQSFEDAGIIFFEAPEPIHEDALQEAEKLSALGVFTDTWKKIYVEEAFKVRDGGKGLTKEQIGEKLQAEWDKGVVAVNDKFGAKPE